MPFSGPGSTGLLLGVALLCGAACAECKLHVYIFIPHGRRLGAKNKKYKIQLSANISMVVIMGVVVTSVVLHEAVC